jgi:hypothetical protein
MIGSLRRLIELLERDTPADSIQGELAAVRQYYADPLGFVGWAFPWGKWNTCQFHRPGDEWQRKLLEQLGREVAARGFDGAHAVDAIRRATASGHGIGKTKLAWVVVCIMSTRPDC